MPSRKDQVAGRLLTSMLMCTLGLAGGGIGLRAQELITGLLPARFELQENPIELVRPARSNRYFEAIGRKAAIFGQESGEFESWVFPFKLFHDARVSVSVQGRDDPVDLARIMDRVIVRPESTTLVAADPLFTLRATFFSPIEEAGSIIILDFDTVRPLVLSVSFLPDLKPMWPAGLGGQSAGWREELKAFVISESRRKYNAFFGSPAAVRGASTPAHQLSAGALRFDIRIDPATARTHYYPILIAAGFNGRPEALERYQRLAGSVEAEYRKTVEHYGKLRREFLSVESPDASFNRAFEWAKAALDKGMIDNPDLGLGLVAGWGATGNGARPGFGWFFGGDAAINSLAMAGYGDFDSMRAAFRFLARYQRRDGKIPHEISQAARMIPWFDEYPYAYYHADTTPFFIVAVHHLYRQSGNLEIVRELWEALRKAYQYCSENDSDGDGILENSKAGLGASELGSLLNDLHQDVLLGAVHTQASLAMKELAGAMQDAQLSAAASQAFERGKRSLNERYRDPATGRYGYALTRAGTPNTEITAWSALPMVFGFLDPERVDSTLRTLASAQLSTDWGTRMLSNASSAYEPTAYNNGGVWPFLTGFASLAEFRYGRTHSGFAHLQQVARLTFDHALGWHPEILSGDYYRPLEESVPHQLFSSGMIVSPLVRGILGLEPDAASRRLRLAPQLPADWDRLQARNYAFGTEVMEFVLQKSAEGRLNLHVGKSTSRALTLELAPLLPPLARVASVTVNGSPVKFNPATAGWPNACTFEVRMADRADIQIEAPGGVEVSVPAPHRQVGESTSSLKVLSMRTAEPGHLILEVEGVAGQEYRLLVRSSRTLRRCSGGSVGDRENGWQVIRFRVKPRSAQGAGQYSPANLDLFFD